MTSVPPESGTVLSAMRCKRTLNIAGKTVFQCIYNGRKILLMHTGIGKVNAAHAVTAMSERFHIQCMIHFGIGGAYPGSGLMRGDLAVATHEIFGDEGVFGEQDRKGMERIGIPLVRTRKKTFFNTYPLDRKLLCKALTSLSGIATVKKGNFVTLSAVSGTQRRARELEKRFHAICENMEGAALAQVCTMYGIPLLELRGISNIAGVRDKRQWDFKGAAENCQKAVVEVIKSFQ
ncbi:futalosine hydrolase [bacterium]|nr:MAG: futalosine hydrolase [bacterium]